MVDSIGLGSAIANSLYLIIAVVAVGGIWFCIKKKYLFGLIFWISSIANFFLYLYLMGDYQFYPKALYLVINNYWPWINLALFILLIINYFKNKNGKTKI